MQHISLTSKDIRGSTICQIWNYPIQLNNRRACIEGGRVHQWLDVATQGDGLGGIRAKQKHNASWGCAHSRTRYRPYSPHNARRDDTLLIYRLRCAE